jgi:hypothetical protein
MRECSVSWTQSIPGCGQLESKEESCRQLLMFIAEHEIRKMLHLLHRCKSISLLIAAKHIY